MKKRASISPKTKKYLQKEINSECPICANQEVGHFEIHHIDENPSNNKFENLLMLCPICHSKITKKEITKDEVIFIKNGISRISNKVEFINVFVEEKLYNWKPDEENNHIFHSKRNEKSISPHLTLNWSFINHLKRTIILKKIIYFGNYLPSGLNGPAIPTIITSMIKYKIPLTLNEKKHTVTFTEQIQVPESQGFQFQTEFFSKWKENVYSLSGRFYLDIIFEFSNNQKIEVPRLFFNCKSENEELKHQFLN